MPQVMREKPKTMKEAVDQLWSTLIDTNGDGFITWIRKQLSSFEERDRIFNEKFDRFLENRAKTCPTREIIDSVFDADDKMWRRQNDRRRLLLSASGWAAFMLAFTMFILTLTGVL